MKRTLLALAGAASLAAAFALPSASSALAASSPEYGHPLCEQNAATCTELNQPVANYTGHDEPSALFYSNTPGSGNNDVYLLRLPTDPKTLPTQNGTGGTFNFQLHPAFWFGMAMCDDQSAPNPGGSSFGATVPCTADSDTNIYNSSDPTSPRYIGRHPGTAFMEMQFYPPGWAPLPAGDQLRRHSVVRGAEHRQPVAKSQHRHTAQRHLRGDHRPGVRELRVHHEERRLPGTGQPGATRRPPPLPPTTPRTCS